MRKWQDLRESFKRIYDMIEEQDSIYLNLMNNQLSPSKLSYSDLEIMLKISQGDKLNNLNQKLITQTKCNTLIYLKQEIEKLIQIINQQFSGILKDEKIQDHCEFQKVRMKLQKLIFILNTQNLEKFNIFRTVKFFKRIINNIKRFINYDLLSTPKIITNLEAKHLHWKGKLGKDHNKVGLWTAEWKDQHLIVCCGQYSQDGKKYGQWTDTIKNFYDYAKAYEVGQYVNDLRSGIWKYHYDCVEIDGREYDDQGQRDGYWNVLKAGITDLIYQGEYDSGKKIGG